jgi:hypothetical protein
LGLTDLTVAFAGINFPLPGTQFWHILTVKSLRFDSIGEDSQADADFSLCAGTAHVDYFHSAHTEILVLGAHIATGQ